MIIYSIIIPFTAIDENLQRCLEHVFRSVSDRKDVEVIVVNNRPFVVNKFDLSAWGQRLRLIEEPRVGSYIARNAGARAAKGRYLIFCDADCFVGQDWFLKLISAIEKNDVVCGVYKIYHPRQWMDFFQGEIARRWYLISDGYKGSNAILRKSLFESIGCFDERFLYSGDIDFGLRLNVRGIKITIASNAQSQHAPRKSLKDLFRQYIGYGYGNACVVAKWKKLSPGFMRCGWLKFISAGWHALGYVYYLSLGFATDRLGRRRLKEFFLLVIDMAYFLGFIKGCFFKFDGETHV